MKHTYTWLARGGERICRYTSIPTPGNRSCQNSGNQPLWDDPPPSSTPLAPDTQVYKTRRQTNPLHWFSPPLPVEVCGVMECLAIWYSRRPTRLYVMCTRVPPPSRPAERQLFQAIIMDCALFALKMCAMLPANHHGCCQSTWFPINMIPQSTCSQST